MVAGTLSDHFGRRRLLTLSLLGAPASLLAFVWVEGWLSYVLLVLTGFTLLSTTPVMLALVQEYAGDSPSTANGLFMMISFLARSAVVVVVGITGDLVGLKLAFILFAWVGFFSLPFILKLPADNP
jgi:FSR family fosmidomycin resistance protein-like MFS transporter